MPSKRYSKLIVPGSFLLDIVLISILLIFFANKDYSIVLSRHSIFFTGAWFGLVYLLKLYSFERTESITSIFRKLTYAFFLHFLIFSTVLNYTVNNFLFKDLFTLYLSVGSIIILWRILFLLCLREYRRKGFNHSNVIIFGYGDLAKELRNFFLVHPEHGFKFLGFFGEDSFHSKLRGNIDTLKIFALENNVHEIYCCLPYLKPPQVKEIVEFGENNFIKVKLIADYSGVLGKGLELQSYGEIPVVNVSAIPLDNLKNRIVKRVFDIVFSLAVIVFVLSLVIPVVAFLIKLESKGPIFFKQKRTGRNNQPFWCWKFRTMTVNQDSDKVQATKNDARITRVGAFLRKTSIDELPQFFNVLMGDMSVVGPRPHMLKHTEEYKKVVENFMVRHQVKPGITGLAQVKGYRGETKELYLMKNRVKMDRFYISNWSFIFDLKIIVLTLLAMYRGDDNAY